MGQEALQALQRARTKIFAGIGETVAIGRVLFSGNIPIVPPTNSGSRRRRTLRGVQSFLSETSTSSSAKPTRALVPWESEEHQGPHGPPTAGYVRGRINVGSLLGVCRQRSEKFKAHPNRPCAGYNGGRSLQVRRLRPCVWTAEIQVRRSGYHRRSGVLHSERG